MNTIVNTPPTTRNINRNGLDGTHLGNGIRYALIRQMPNGEQYLDTTVIANTAQEALANGRFHDTCTDHPTGQITHIAMLNIKIMSAQPTTD